MTMTTITAPPEGRVQQRRARSSGTLVEVWRPGTVSDDPGWVTLCEHASICHHDTRELAVSHAAAPEGWCETGCRHAAYQRDGCATCGGKLDWADDSWICLGCGNEFQCPCYDCEPEAYR